MSLAEEANKAGILMEYQNVDVPQVRAKFGGGYIGANLEPQGRALAAEAIAHTALWILPTIISSFWALGVSQAVSSARKARPRPLRRPASRSSASYPRQKQQPTRTC